MSTHSPTGVRWSPPPPNSLKVNFDGATFKDIGRAGLGVVVRDCQGHALASLSERVPFPFSSDLVEALAAARAISFALEIGYLSFILEGDSEHVINTLSSNEDSLSPFGHILDSAKALTESGCISFSHVRRLGNSVAHNLAKHGIHVSGYLIWMEDVPPHLYSILLVDVG
ncbi:uncharacterized protein LOC142620799 [Castanea sativa]|uniref:uncharacterized protein LOC142620799 n=1 Tax=Castanea sativa TaxID=21020 RepID=UPI003F653866